MKPSIVAMLLVGGRGTRLQPITRRMAKPAVPFAGKYKLVDFVLSNLTNSGIDTVGILTQYEPHSLMDYIGHGASWDLDLVRGGVHFLTPYTSFEGEKWQKGTAHAIRQHLRFIDRYDPEWVLILSGDHVYKMDYRKLLAHHQKSGADYTIAGFYPDADLSRFGVIEMDASNRLQGFEEKPEDPKGSLASMGVYLFNREALKRALSEDLEEGFDFGKDIIPKTLSEGYEINVYPYEGYFRDVGTIDSLYQANMEVLDHPGLLKLNDYRKRPVHTKSSNQPPHHIMCEDSVHDSLISDGCLIRGSVIHSILSEGVFIKDDALVRNSVLHPDVTIGEDATVENAIVLEGTMVMPGMSIRFDRPEAVDNERLWALGGDDDD